MSDKLRLTKTYLARNCVTMVFIFALSVSTLTISSLIIGTLTIGAAHAQNNNDEQVLLTTKQRHVIDSFTTFNGHTLKQVNIGWESYGNLNQDKSNVILITHYFTGNSHHSRSGKRSGATWWS